MCDARTKVSIVIPAYNAANYLAEAIDSALAQTYPNVEILVINDGSPDGGATREVALSYGDKIRYFEKENGGSSSALNCGIKNMTGQWFSWLSHDDLYDPQKIAKQIAYLEALQIPKEELPRHIFFGGSDHIDGQGKVIRPFDAAKAKETERKLASLPGNEYLVAEPTGYLFHGCSCLIHREAFAEAGMFDEGLRLINDADMWYRLYMAGYIVHFVPERLVSGRVHSKQISRSIGFSYHNPEQDLFWGRCLAYLKKNAPENYDLFYTYGKNAYLKTRNTEADEAFAIAALLCPKRRAGLWLRKTGFCLYAGLRSLAKKIYIKIRL